jgi:tetratricopeptide (TPR) repeat protein
MFLEGAAPMAKDQQGLTLAGSPQSAEAYDRAVADYFGLTGDPVGVLKQALKDDPDFALGGVATAGLFMIGGFRGDHPEVKAALASAESATRSASSRERMHLAAVKAWSEGRSPDAALLWESILIDWPTDALALRFGQDAYLFLGRSLSIRDAAARVLPAWDRDNPLTSFILGTYAFGLEEAGELGPAEHAGREALTRNPRDAWAAHAIAHVMETGGRQEEGIAFLRDTRPDWGAAHFMAGHNGWHLALFQIEQGRFREVLADYDRFAAPKLVDDMTLDRVDAASLLWRLELAGADVGDRWGPVAAAWMAHVDDHVLAFNDLHCALAAARSPNREDLGRFRRSLDAYERHGSGHNRLVTAEVGRRFIDGAIAYAEGDWRRAIDAMLPVRFETFRIGGSHAQRDIINRTLIAAAERAGDRALVQTLHDERGRAPASAGHKGAFKPNRRSAGLN